MIQANAGFYITTSQGRWGRGLTLPETIKAAGNINITKGDVAFLMVMILFSDKTEKEIKEKVLKLYSVNGFGGVVVADDCTEQDKKLIKKHVLGYCVTDNHEAFDAYKEKMKKKVKK